MSHPGQPSPPLASLASAQPAASSGQNKLYEHGGPGTDDGQFSDAEEDEGPLVERRGSDETMQRRPSKMSSRASGTTLSAVPLPDLPPPVPSIAASFTTPPASPPRASPDLPPPLVEEMESLAVTAESQQDLPFPPRKSSLTPSVDDSRAGLSRASSRRSKDGRRPSADSGRRPSTDGGSVRSGTSGHKVNPGAKHYFPLVGSSKGPISPPFPTADLSPPSAPPSPADSAGSVDFNPLPASQPRRPSGPAAPSSSQPGRSAVFPTITPNRLSGAAAVGGSVFPTVRRPSATTTSPPDQPGSVLTSSRSTPSIPSLPSIPAASPAPSSSVQHFSPPPSSYAPSIAPSSRSGQRDNYAPSIAPSQSASNYAPSTRSGSDDGPVSIFYNPEATKRPLTDLLPKKKLTSLFSRGKDKAAAASPAGPGARVGPNGMTYRGKSTSVLDAALATSTTWANRRGEQQRSFAPPAGYRPAHQIQRQWQEEQARLAAEQGPGGAVSPDALSAALAQAGGANAQRRPSLTESVRTVDSPASGRGSGGASPFPTTTRPPGAPVFAMKPRPKPPAQEGQEGGSTGLGIS
ncbi:hypothetical protein JCM8097_006908 [Rhodosporidiobolus ruineniae]